MSEATATDADEALLDELAGMLISAARMAHERMATAQDDKAFHAAGQTLHRMARSLRQTLALKQRSRREAEQAQHEQAMQAANRRIEQVIRRREVIKAAVERIYWTEHEALDADDDTADAVLDAIAEHCEAATLDPDFLDRPIAAQVARICQAAGLPVPTPPDRPGESRDPDRETPAAAGTGSERIEPTSESPHLDPGVRRDDREDWRGSG